MSEPATEPGTAPEGAPAFSVTFQPSGRRGSAAAGQDLMSVARALGVEIESTCGGKGTCKKCRVHLESGPDSLSAPTSVEEKALGAATLASGMRLACQSRVAGDVKVFVPESSRRSRQVVRKEAGEHTVPLDPAVIAYPVTLEAPTLREATADAERLLAGLEEKHGLKDLEFDFPMLQTLPGVCRKAGWDLEVIVWQGRTIVEVRAAAENRPVLGLAVDVGTTTIAAYLCDLESGDVLATESAMNPQVAFGDDLIARLHYVAHHEGGLAELQRTVITEVNDLASKAVRRAGATAGDIFDVVMVGNTAMHHLFLGLQTAALGVAPFAPAVQGPVDTLASAVGLEFSRGCRLHVLPVEAGFVGADNVAVIIAEEPYKQDKVLLLLDIGTNGELVLGNRERMLSTSCATGPAFEGSHVEFGMRAAPGAIERIRIDPETLDVRFKVIGLEGWQTNYPPEEVGARGICGSGIIEAAGGDGQGRGHPRERQHQPRRCSTSGWSRGRQAAQVHHRPGRGDLHRTADHGVAQGHPFSAVGQGGSARRRGDPAAALRSGQARRRRDGRGLRHLHRQASRACHRHAARYRSRTSSPRWATRPATAPGTRC